MVQAKLLKVTKQNGITYFTLEERGVGTVGTYTEYEVYKALIDNKIEIDYLKASIKHGKVLVDPSFIVMQIHKSNLYLEPEIEIVSRTKKKVKNKVRSSETDERLIKIDEQIKDVGRQITSKSVRLAKKESQLHRCILPEVAVQLQEIVDMPQRNYDSLKEKKQKLIELRQQEEQRIKQEKRDLKKCNNIIKKSPYSLEEYNGLVDNIEQEIESLKSSLHYKYEINNAKQINRLNKQLKQLKHFKNSRNTLFEVINKKKERNTNNEGLYT